MVSFMKYKTLLSLNYKVRKNLHVNNIFIVLLFVYLFHILFKLILKRGNISNKCQI